MNASLHALHAKICSLGKVAHLLQYETSVLYITQNTSLQHTRAYRPKLPTSLTRYQKFILRVSYLTCLNLQFKNVQAFS